MQGQIKAQCIKSLYQQKFYQPKNNNSHTLVGKVISFQQKMERFKINRNYSQRIEQNPSFLVEDEGNRFRPTTNYTHSRQRKSRYSGQYTSRGQQGPAVAELKIILDRSSNTAEMNILRQSIRERNLYSKNQSRKKWRLVSNRQSLTNKDQSEYPRSKATPIDMGLFYQENKSIRTERQKRPAILKSDTRKENEGQFAKNKIMSKRVLIGGRDLSKAAEEQHKNYLQLQKNLQLLVQEQRKKDLDTADKIKKITIQKKRIRRISPRKGGMFFLKKDDSAKTEPKTFNKQEDDILHYQLDPWSVQPEIC